ncbi:hypothetical protein NWP96_03975 [Mycoplasmopsis cynos]|nr:hypothetical protein [Mycoplasmopsis cynos]
MDKITKYLGQRTPLSGNNVTSGFYLDAKQLLDSIANQDTGKEANKAHFKALFEKIGVAENGEIIWWKRYQENWRF